MKLDPSMQAVLAVYQNGGEISNDHLYQAVKEPLGFDDDDYNVRHAIGKAGKKHCVAQRKVRWFQQSLRRLELVERVPGRRGVWRLRPREDQQLTPPVFDDICLIRAPSVTVLLLNGFAASPTCISNNLLCYFFCYGHRP